MWVVLCCLAIGLEEVFSTSIEKPLSNTFRNRILNLSNGLVICLSIFLITPLTTIFVFYLGNKIGIGLIDLRFFPTYNLTSQILSALMLVFVEDFIYYFYHRMAHKTPMLWDIHAVHHSDTQLNATTTLRRHWLETPLQEALVALPLALVFRLTPIEMTVVAFSRAGFVFFAHMNIRIQFGRFSWLLTSPQLHRLHHSNLRDHWDSNYAQVFPIFDKIFGTYVAPKWDEFPPTGLASNERIDTLSDLLFWPFRAWTKRWRKNQ